MLNGLKKLLGIGPKVDFVQLILDGAIIVDVRSRGEYAGGHVEGSLNIPLDQLDRQVDQLKKKKKPVITCCASGMRSASAKRILESHGIEAYNGGPWTRIDNLA